MPTATPDNMISEEEFEQIYKENYESFIRYATTIFKANGSQYVSASGRAEEAVQEMCAVAWKKRDELSAAPSPFTSFHCSDVISIILSSVHSPSHTS